MLNSMTGFGRCECSNDKYKVTVEMKAVNHRYFDLNIKMPRKFNAFESAVRTVLKEYIQRGKVDVFITYEDFSEETVNLKYNESIAREYMEANGISRDSAVFIGDTCHDWQVSEKIGCRCLLVEGGHMSRERLESTGAPVAEDIAGILKELY